MYVVIKLTVQRSQIYDTYALFRRKFAVESFRLDIPKSYLSYNPPRINENITT